MGKGMKLFVPMLVLMLVAVTSAADLDMQKEVHELDHGEAQRVNMVGEDDQGGRRAGGNANINNNNHGGQTTTTTTTQQQQQTQYHPCAAGMAASGANGLCVDCAKGKFTDSTGRQECADCAKGKHGDTVASTTCKDCVIGKYADDTGDDSGCKACSKGKITSSVAQSTCTDCVAGKFAAQTSSSTCAGCTAGKYQNEAAKSSCKDCSTPNVVSADKTSCQAQGRRSSTGGLSTAGQFSLSSGGNNKKTQDTEQDLDLI